MATHCSVTSLLTSPKLRAHSFYTALIHPLLLVIPALVWHTSCTPLYHGKVTHLHSLQSRSQIYSLFGFSFPASLYISHIPTSLDWNCPFLSNSRTHTSTRAHYKVSTKHVAIGGSKFSTFHICQIWIVLPECQTARASHTWKERKANQNWGKGVLVVSFLHLSYPCSCCCDFDGVEVELIEEEKCCKEGLHDW